MSNGNINDVPMADDRCSSPINITVCRPEPKAQVTLELKQPCGICGYIASNDCTYIDKNGKEVHQYLCNDCAPELAKNFKFLSVKEI